MSRTLNLAASLRAASFGIPFLSLLIAAPARPARAAEPAPGSTATVSKPAAAFEVVESLGSYQSQGKSIAIEKFEPKAPGKYPIVLLVHGAGGMAIGGSRAREAGRELAGRGYIAHVVHYFDLTGTKIASRATMEAHFPAWMKALAEGITNASRQDNADPTRVGMVGYSLGSYLSLSLSLYDARVLGVVEYFGGLPEQLLKDVKTLPPTLILHGDTDPVVPVTEAKALEKLFKEKNCHHELRIYPGQGHYFHGESGADALQRCASFLDTHVKGAKSETTRKRETSSVPRPESYRKYISAAS